MFINFDQFHCWNYWLCPPLGFLTNFSLLWLILHKTPKEMKIHSRILLQTCIVDLLLLSMIAIAQPILAIQPDSSMVLFFHGIFAELFQNSPISMAYFFTLWFLIHTFEWTGISVQFLYRFLVLNCNIRITIPRYFSMLAALILPIFMLSIFWLFIIIKSINQPPFNAKYFANFMDIKNEFKITYFTDLNSVEFGIWDILFNGMQFIAYGTVIFCGIKMLRFVYVHSFNQKHKEMHKQLSINLIILASFPLFLLSLNYFFRFIIPRFQFSNEAATLIGMFQGLIAHWLPILNPLASILTIKPYRNFIKRKFKNTTIINPIPTN